MSDFDNFDDLDAVRDFRSLASPFPATVHAGVRRRIFEIAAERGYASAPPAPGTDPSAGPTSARVDSRAESPPTDGARRVATVVQLGSTGRVRARRRRHLLAGVAMVLVLSVAVGVLIRRPMPTSGTVEAASAGAWPAAPGRLGLSPVLGVAGLQRFIRAQPDRPLPVGMVEYRKVERGGMVAVTDGGPVVMELSVGVEERWAAADRPGSVAVTLDAPGEPRLAPQPASADEIFAGLPYAAVRALPADEVALDAHVEEEAARREGDEGAVIEVVLDRLVEAVVRPQVRAALVGLLAGRGLAPAGPLADRRGRLGNGYFLEEGAWRWTLVFDAGDGVLRSWERRRRDDGSVDAFLVVLESRIVAEVPDS